MNSLEELSQFYLNLPFNKFLGLQAEGISAKKACLTFQLKQEFIGNTHKNILHGGVIASVMDACGGILALASLYHKLSGLSRQQIIDKLCRSSTIDMRVDFLHPGVGTQFKIEAELLRSGKRIAVTKMQLHNETQMIANGSATFLLGQD